MRSRTRRSFSVEIKPAGNRQTTVIPSRIASTTIPAPSGFRDLLAESAPLPAEPRRILKSLIMPEPPSEPALVIEDRLQRRRGRPRKASAAVVEAASVASTIEEPEIGVEPLMLIQLMESPPAPKRAKRIVKPDAAFAPGERWKRRLGRWSR